MAWNGLMCLPSSLPKVFLGSLKNLTGQSGSGVNWTSYGGIHTVVASRNAFSNRVVRVVCTRAREVPPRVDSGTTGAGGTPRLAFFLPVNLNLGQIQYQCIAILGIRVARLSGGNRHRVEN